MLTCNMAQNEQDEQDKASQAYAALGVGFVCLIIGLPLWWKTTDVYRVQLPYEDMESLAQQYIEYAVNLDVIVFDEKLESAELNIVSDCLQKALNVKSGGNDGISSMYRVSVKTAQRSEVKLYQNARDIDDLDRALYDVFEKKQNQHSAIVLPDRSRFSNKMPYVGKFRNSFHEYSGINTVCSEIQKTLQDIVVHETWLERTLQLSKGSRHLKPDKESMRAVKSNPAYDVTFTLVNPQPDIVHAHWDMENAVKDYLQPLLDQMSQYAQINVKSQVLYYTGLVSQAKKDRNNHRYYYSVEDLPHMINPLESKLGSHVSNCPSLEFIVYIPTQDQSPLYIYDTTGGMVETNSFLSPRWGGVLIYNPPALLADTQLPYNVDVNMKSVMEVFITQFRLLIGIHVAPQSESDVQFAAVGNKGINEWELDGWLRQRCVENLVTASSTLKSLAQLLGQISNIVINDEIGQEVEDAVSSIKQCQKAFRVGDLQAAFQFSKDAIISSEKAFFDPSLLELLYFPEDQKFAIYIPLFLPISIPVILSVLQSVKWMKNRRKNKETHLKKE